MKTATIYVVLAVALVTTWNTSLIIPIKILIVFFHEFSHALAVWTSGGVVEEFVITAAQGGHVNMLGGNRFMALFAGYLGSLLIGAAILLATGYTEKDKYLTAALGVVLIGVAAGFIRTPFGLGYCLIAGGLMLAAARLLSHEINDYILHFVAMTNLLYVPLDIYSDTIQRSHLRSDARMLAEEFAGTTVMWGIAWLLISVVIGSAAVYLRIRMAHRRSGTVAAAE